MKQDINLHAFNFQAMYVFFECEHSRLPVKCAKKVSGTRHLTDSPPPPLPLHPRSETSHITNAPLQPHPPPPATPILLPITWFSYSFKDLSLKTFIVVLWTKLSVFMPKYAHFCLLV